MSGFIPMGEKDAGRILVVDDDEGARYAKSRVLRQAGYTVLEAASGNEALRSVLEDHPDLVLLDVRLPDVNGLEVCRRIKSDPQSAPIPVLQMSASFRDENSKLAGLKSGADGYVTEPVEPPVLVATIAAFLRMRRAEQSVRELALEWEATFDAISEGIALVDTEGKIVRSNRSLASLLNRTAAGIAGMGLDELLPAPVGDSAVWSEVKAGRHQHFERAAGDRVFAITVDPLRGNNGCVRGGVCTVYDITARKLMDERLWHSQKLESIGVLAGGVAHDFNNLLTGILGNATLALHTLDDPQSTQRALRDILRASERAADLTRQLLAYSGKGRIVSQRLDLSHIVSEMVPLVRASFPTKAGLVLRLADDLPAIEADKTQVEQIVMNLLINAAEAIGEKAGTVTVKTHVRHLSKDERPNYLADTEVRGEYAMLEVRDDGIGMDEETAKRIFDPFFTTKFMGRGLGLSAVLGIMRGHNGAIRVKSAPGRGTTFEVLFPVAAAVARVDARPAAPVAADYAPGGGRILVVDDEEIVRDFFKTALEMHGFEVVVANNGADALRIFAREPNRFSVVLLDLMMPVMSGKETLPRLLELRPDATVVIASGRVEEDVRSDLGDWKIAGFIQKPCTVEALVATVRKFAGAKTLAAR